MLDLPLLAATMKDCGRKLPHSNNLAGSDDWRDLYYLVDYLTFAMDRQYEGQPCKAGCSLCCRENSVFRVSDAEWAAIKAFLEQQDEDWIDALIGRTESAYRDFASQLADVAQAWGRSSSWSTENPHLGGLPALCPALVDDRCSIYDARPLVCRAYGYFAVTVRETETLMICRAFGQGFLDWLKESGLERAPIPNFEPFDRQLRHLNSTGIIKPLPLWLLDWGAEYRLRASRRGAEVELA